MLATFARVFERTCLISGNSFSQRSANIAELTVILDEIFKTRSTAEWMELLTAEGVLASPINDYGAWLEHPQSRHKFYRYKP